MNGWSEGEGRPEATIDVLGALVDQQARVARAEVALAAARARLQALQERYRGLGGVPALDAGAWVEPPSRRRDRCGRAVSDGGPSVRTRLLAALVARPGEVLTSPQLAALVGARSRDTVRNALLVLAERGAVEKVGPGQYRAPLPLTS